MIQPALRPFPLLALLATLLPAPADAARAPSPEQMEISVCGFTLGRDPEGRLWVEAVAKDGPAARAGLPLGARVLRVVDPVQRTPELAGELTELPLRFLAPAFFAAPEAPISIEVEEGGKRRIVAMQRTLPATLGDPPPPPKPRPWASPEAEKKRLEQHEKRVAQQRKLAAKLLVLGPPTPVRSDELSLTAERPLPALAVAGDGTLAKLNGGYATPKRLLQRFWLGASCDGEPIAKLTVESKLLPAPIVIDGAGGARLEQRALWLPYLDRAALGSCTKPGGLVSTELVARLRCRSGKETIRRRVAAFTTECGAAAAAFPATVGKLSGGHVPAVSPDVLGDGVTSTVRIQIEGPWVDDLSLVPAWSVEPVRLDEQGKVVSTLGPALPRKAASGAGGGPFTLPLAGDGRPLRLALRLTHRDGSVEVSPSVTLLATGAAEARAAGAKADARAAWDVEIGLIHQQVAECETNRGAFDAWLRARSMVSEVSWPSEGRVRFRVRGSPNDWDFEFCGDAPGF